MNSWKSTRWEAGNSAKLSKYDGNAAMTMRSLQSRSRNDSRVSDIGRFIILSTSPGLVVMGIAADPRLIASDSA